jgi:hypothetical protein
VRTPFTVLLGLVERTGIEQGGQAGGTQLTVELLDVDRAQALDSDRAKMRGDVLSDTFAGLVSRTGRPARRAVVDVALDQLLDRHA